VIIGGEKMSQNNVIDKLEVNNHAKNLDKIERMALYAKLHESSKYRYGGPMAVLAMVQSSQKHLSNWQ
jgi:hypothetical protein